jgi:hypothetical protein
MMTTEKHTVRNWLAEWFIGHGLWEIGRHLFLTVLAALVGSYALARLLDKALNTATFIFLLVLGVLGIAWGTGFLPAKRKSSVSISRENLKRMCDEQIAGWEDLDRDYMDAPPEQKGGPSLPDPLASAWVSYEMKHWPYKVGFLQGGFFSLQACLVTTEIPAEIVGPRTTMPQLLRILREYKRLIEELR